MAKKAKKEVKKKEVKKKPYKSVEDEQSVVNEDEVSYEVVSRVKKEDELVDDDLTESQLKRLKQSIKEAEEGKTMSWAEFKKRTARWRTK